LTIEIGADGRERKCISTFQRESMMMEAHPVNTEGQDAVIRKDREKRRSLIDPPIPEAESAGVTKGR